MSIQVGANASEVIKITLATMTAKALGVSDAIVGAIGKGSTGDANSLTSAIDAALVKVSTQRAKFGALQNRLEHTIKNVDNTSENLQSAESRIRDVDVAKEMVKLSKLNILTQASQAMVSQAKQQPEQVTQLLR